MLPDYLSIIQKVIRDSQLPGEVRAQLMARFSYELRMQYPSFNVTAFFEGCGYIPKEYADKLPK